MPNRKSKSNHKGKALVPMDFQLNEMVFAKQKGYVPWPGIITAFHPNKPRCVRVDFFAWDQQWAYITFNCLFKMEIGRALVQESMSKNTRLYKAVEEMDFVENVTRLRISEQLRLRAVTTSKETPIACANQGIVSDAQSKSIDQNEKRTKSKKPTIVTISPSNLNKKNRVLTRYQNRLGSNSQPNSAESTVAMAEENNSCSTVRKERKNRPRKVIEDAFVNNVQTSINCELRQTRSQIKKMK